MLVFAWAGQTPSVISVQVGYCAQSDLPGRAKTVSRFLDAPSTTLRRGAAKKRHRCRNTFAMMSPPKERECPEHVPQTKQRSCVSLIFGDHGAVKRQLSGPCARQAPDRLSSVAQVEPGLTSASQQIEEEWGLGDLHAGGGTPNPLEGAWCGCPRRAATGRLCDNRRGALGEIFARVE